MFVSLQSKVFFVVGLLKAIKIFYIEMHLWSSKYNNHCIYVALLRFILKVVCYIISVCMFWKSVFIHPAFSEGSINGLYSFMLFVRKSYRHMNLVYSKLTSDCKCRIGPKIFTRRKFFCQLHPNVFSDTFYSRNWFMDHLENKCIFQRVFHGRYI